MKKPDAKYYISYIFINMKCPEKVNRQRQKEDQWFPRARDKNED